MLKQLISMLDSLFATGAPQPALIAALDKRGVPLAAWKARDRSRHRVHAALYDDMLQ